MKKLAFVLRCMLLPRRAKILSRFHKEIKQLELRAEIDMKHARYNRQLVEKLSSDASCLELESLSSLKSASHLRKIVEGA